MRILDFSDGFESATEPQQGFIKASSLQNFADDAAYVAAKTSAATVGDIYFNTTENTIHFYTDTGWNSWYVERYLALYAIAAPQAANTVMTLLASGSYVVGGNQLYISLNGQLLEKGYDYNEIGTAGTTSTTIEMIPDLVEGDRVIIRK